MMFILICSGCDDNNDKTEFIWGTEYSHADVLVNYKNPIGLCIPYAYSGSYNVIEFVDAEGVNLDKVNIEIFDDTIFNYKDIEVEGYKLGLIGIIVRLKENTDIEINKLTIKVDDVKYDITLANPIKYKAFCNEDDMWASTSADIILTGTECSISYIINANSNIEITGYDLTNPFQNFDVKSYYNNIVTNKAQIKMQEKDSFTIEAYGKFNKAQAVSFYQSNVIIYYIDSEGEAQKYIINVGKQGVSNEESVNTMLQLILDEKGEQDE